MRLEPIGILQFLQSLLSSTAQKQENPPEPTPAQNNEKTSDTQDDIAPSEQNRSAQDAILRFLEAHETRANRHKK